MADSDHDLGKSTLNLNPKIAGLLCYLGGFVTGIIFYLLEKENKFVRFHAMQSLITFGGIFAVQIFISFLPGIQMLAPLLSLLSLGIWVVGMIKAYGGDKFKFPLVGDIAEKNS